MPPSTPVLIRVQHGFVFILAFALCLSAFGQVRTVDFGTDILPILSSRCLGCHSGDRAQGKLKIHTRADLLNGGASGPAIVPGDAARSLFFRKILGQQGMRMPPSGPALSAESVEAIRIWIDQGAKYDGVLGTIDRLAPMEPREPALPGSDDDHPVDRLLQPYFSRNQVASAEPVSDAAFARRAWFDILGLPPSPEDLATFVNATDPKKREALIAKLLADRKNYAEHWMSYWNDLLRNDEGVVYHGERKSITNWLYRSLKENKPYDRMVRELLNPALDPSAAGYLTGVTWRGVVSASQTPSMQASQNAAQVFLGMNLKCAACHDSFVNRWKLADTYGLAAMFAEEPMELVRCDVKTGKIAEARFPVDDLGVRFWETPESRKEAAANWFTHEQNGRFARTIVNRYWKLLFGRAIVEPVDDMDAEPWNSDLLDWLASDFATHGYDLQRLIQTITTSRAYQMATVPEPKDGKPYVFRGPIPRRLSAEQFQDSISAVTGEWRVQSSRSKTVASYAREWRLKSDALSRALGRPIRDQVYTERTSAASTLQALELTNGPLLSSRLQRAVRTLLGQSDSPPVNLFDSSMMRNGSAKVNIDITGARELWLLVEDVDSYDPSRVIAGWVRPTLVENRRTFFFTKKKRPLAQSTLQMQRRKGRISAAVPAPLSQLVHFPLDRNYERFQAEVAIDERSRLSEIAPGIRFFVFKEKPDLERLVRIEGTPPLPLPDREWTSSKLADYLYQYLLSRAPTEKERIVALQMLGEERPSAEGTEDLVWALLMSPEFQFLN